jgi:prevent-host-death family protein
MRELAISKFKVNCLAVVEEVRRTGKPIRITRFGKPVAELVAAKPEKKKFTLGAMKGKMEIVGDIVGPVGAFEPWDMDERNLV